jgi:hypothetical protein
MYKLCQNYRLWSGYKYTAVSLPYSTSAFGCIALYVIGGYFNNAFVVFDDANIRRLFIFVKSFCKLFLNFFYCNMYCIDIQSVRM